MKEYQELYRKVADACSAYAPCGKCTCGADNGTNSTSTNHGAISCMNCEHFDRDHYCELDLYDQIVEDHHFN